MGARSAHILLFGCPVTKIVDMIDTFFQTRKKMTCLASTRGGKGAKVGGRSGASGGRGRLRLRALKGLVSLSSTPCYLLTRCGGFIGYRLCRRPLKKSAGDDFWRPWLSWDAPCKPFETFGMHWGQQGSQSELFGTPVQVGAPIPRPGGGGGGL